MAEGYLQLGDFTFQDLELPEVIKRGGRQSVTIQKLVGGARVVDAMGRDDDPLTWEGIFMGGSAYDRAAYIDSLRIAGQQLTLAWNNNNYTVVISAYTYESRFNDLFIPYSITCEVVSDNVTASTPGLVPNVDDQMDLDNSSMLSLSGDIGDSTLSSLALTLNSAIGAVSTFANAGPSTIASVTAPLSAVNSRLVALMTANQAIANGSASFGGVLPGVPIAQNVSAIDAQVDAFQQMGLIAQMQGVCGRIAQNCTSVGTNTQTVTVGGGNLMSMASSYYGDATAWDAIANANGMTDPQIQGIQQIVVPMKPTNNGGLLGVS